MEIIIYGAKSIALGISQAIKNLYPKYKQSCFLVTSLSDNPKILAGMPVLQVDTFSGSLTQEEKNNVHILIGTPEDLHNEIIVILKKYGFIYYTCIDSQKESALMEKYYERKKIFLSLHSLPQKERKVQLQIFMAKFHKDKVLEKDVNCSTNIISLQVGASLTKKRVSNLTDNIGDNISEKNVNYCELTALYWIWKNRICNISDNNEYYGLCHYRRILDIQEDDLYRISGNDIDVILPFPTLHEPNICEHHTRYVKESDWDALIRALLELCPEYVNVFQMILEQPYFYNYNLMIAKKRILSNYCEWLFPILERIEELSIPRGWERSDRYIGYLAENLMTLYFLYNRDRLKIYHTGRLMLT